MYDGHLIALEMYFLFNKTATNVDFTGYLMAIFLIADPIIGVSLHVPLM